ncbi:MAG TPA: hypothetical protein VGO47_12550, partial [Chlamydiales bacterium]|nr:hypothetical protein [Chlamydiales bacterium]
MEAFQFIHYFSRKLVDNRYQIRNGEIASLLCLMISLTYSNFKLPFTEGELISLLMKDFQILHKNIRV